MARRSPSAPAPQREMTRESLALGVVLAGGSSSRMGHDKALSELGGRRMIDHVVAALRRAGLEPIVAGPVRPGVDAGFVADPAGLAGPAAGLAAVMRSHPGADVVLVGTDQPYLRSETVRGLLEIEGRLVAPVDGRRQTLCAVYRAEAHAALEDLLAGDQSPSLQALFDAGGVEIPASIWQAWGEDGRSWLSIDTRIGLEAAAAAWPEPPSGTIRP